MEKQGFKRDEKPYIVFQCSKCSQYSYVKTTQKSKKCPRCGHAYQVISLLSKGIIVNGMTSAVNKVKELQNKLGEPTFHAEHEFTVSSIQKVQINRNINKNLSLKLKDEDLYQTQFIYLLHELSDRHKLFPLYIIDLMALDYNIPKDRIKKLIDQFILNKKIIKKGNNQYMIQLPI